MAHGDGWAGGKWIDRWLVGRCEVSRHSLKAERADEKHRQVVSAADGRRKVNSCSWA